MDSQCDRRCVLVEHGSQRRGRGARWNPHRPVRRAISDERRTVAAAGLFALMSQVQSLPAFYAIWLGLGVVMAAVLYDAAFTVITAQFGTSARKAITTLTLAGGFASTVFWPLTQWLVASLRMAQRRRNTRAAQPRDLCSAALAAAEVRPALRPRTPTEGETPAPMRRHCARLFAVAGSCFWQ